MPLKISLAITTPKGDLSCAAFANKRQRGRHNQREEIEVTKTFVNLMLAHNREQHFPEATDDKTVI